MIDKKSVKVIIAFRSYATDPHVSHAGLGIAAINTTKTLNQHGIWANVWPIVSEQELEMRLDLTPGITHVTIQAPWVRTATLARIANKFPDVQFAVNCHSNVGFLQAEPQAVTKMLELLDLEQASNNVHAAGNNQPFVDWIKFAYQRPCTILPNLYYVDDMADTFRPAYQGGNLRIGIFGAPRAQKNVMTGVAGAIQIAQMMKAQTEIWVNIGRLEGVGKTIFDAAKRAIAPNPFTTVKEFSWASWPEFRRHVGSMHLLIQASYTESFNQVTADGVVTGVPTVCSTAIRWAPDYWKADVDCADSVAQVGHSLLRDPLAHRDGLEALRDHNTLGLHDWMKYISGKSFKKEI
jgi:hypothetical protein